MGGPARKVLSLEGRKANRRPYLRALPTELFGQIGGRLLGSAWTRFWGLHRAIISSKHSCDVPSGSALALSGVGR